MKEKGFNLDADDNKVTRLTDVATDCNTHISYI